MKVELIGKTSLTGHGRKLLGVEDQSDTKVIAFSAIRTCYSHVAPFDIYQLEKHKFLKENTHHIENGSRGADALIKHITSSGHTSTLEHVCYTFFVEGVSRTLLAQLTRHRHFSFSVQSQRYVTFSSSSKSNGADFYIPSQIQNNPEALSTYLETLDKIQESYDYLKSLKIPSEDARMLLPNAALCNLVLTGNLRSVLEFYQKRNASTHAQKEIQDLAEALRLQVTSEDDWTVDFFEKINPNQ